jgi:translation initiation factor IF-2
MAKKKVWELAREIAVTLPDLMRVLPSLAIVKKDHLEFLEPEEEARIKGFYQDRSAGANTEQKVVAKNIVRRRAVRPADGAAAAPEAVPLPPPVPETVPTVVEAPEPEPEAAGAGLAPAQEQIAAGEAAPVEAPSGEMPAAGAAPEAQVAAAPQAAGAAPATTQGAAGAPAQSAEEAAKARLLLLQGGKKPDWKTLVEKEAAEDEKKRGAAKAKKGRRIVIDRKTKSNLKRVILEDTDGGDAEGAATTVLEPRSSERRNRRMAQRGDSPQPVKPQKRVVRVEESISVAELAREMSVKANVLLMKLMEMGSMATLNTSLDVDTASILAEEFDYRVERVARAEERYTAEVEDAEVDLSPRPPVVTIMGHVDHGKTSLLDAIQKSNLADKEAGGITQAIGAYRVQVERGAIVFLDTPGHAAFTAMRARGAKVTDLVILVVAADDGVQPQTIEAINHARDAGVPIVVAVNKIDKDNADPDRTRRELAEQGLVCEDWGGDVIFMNVSAKQRTGVTELLDMVLLQAEMLNLRANAEAPASGFVIESRLDKSMGAACTVLVKRGTLKAGDLIVAGAAFGRVRSMQDEHGRAVEVVGPSYPAEITGLSEVPQAGEPFFAVTSEREAREIVEARQDTIRKESVKERKLVSLESLFSDMESGQLQELKIILKADVQGSLEAIRGALEKLSGAKVAIKVIHAAIGGVTQADVQLAAAGNAVIFGFNVRADNAARQQAQDDHVDIKVYSIIYDLLDDVKAAMEGLLAPRIEESVIGHVEVRQVFTIPKIGTIAGCYVQSGKVVRNSKVRVFRDNIKVWDGKIGSLKRHKDDAKEVASGFECGLGVENFNDIKEGDLIEVIEEKEVKETL